MCGHAMSARNDPFDRPFMLAAVSIGGAYVLIVFTVQKLHGTDAAGVTGVALTALATAIFREYENLQFRRTAQAKGWSVEIPRINFSYAILLVSACMGIQGFVSIVAAVGFAVLTGSDVTYENVNAWLGRLGYERYMVLMAAVFFLTGLLAGRTAPAARYLYVSAVSLFYVALVIAWLALMGTTTGHASAAAGVLGITALLFVVCATAGAWLGFRRR
jgi:hypothetical protein